MNTQTKGITVNAEQRLYVIPCGKGYSCHGFDVVARLSKGIAEWLGKREFVLVVPGTVEAYTQYQELCAEGRNRNLETRERCPIDLTPELIGLENKRIEVVDTWGERRRFYVGKSTGWLPIHLELMRRNSSGGGAVCGSPFKSLRIIGAR